MKLLWNNTANKTKDNLDKLLATFSTAYEKFEEESISSLVVSLQMGAASGKFVFGGLQTTKSQTSLCLRTVWSAPLLFTSWKL